MKVRMLVSIASPTWAYSPGEVAEVDTVEAKRWIAAGIAELLTGPVETATVSPPENAAMPAPRRKRVRR